MDEQAVERTSLASLVEQIAADLAQASAGELAELRRLTPNDYGGSTFWRILITRLDPELPRGEPERSRALGQWAIILRALAELGALHHPRQSLGTAMAEAGISELRLNRLLRAGGEALFDEVRRITHQLVSAGVAVDTTDVARLVLSEGRSDALRVRQHIANDYYRQLYRKEKETN
jgi:CRISPR type I-E-associated protein CasB/Cse2